MSDRPDIGRLTISGPAGTAGQAWALAGARWAWTANNPNGHHLGQGIAATAGDAVHDCLDVMVAWRDQQQR